MSNINKLISIKQFDQDQKPESGTRTENNDQQRDQIMQARTTT